MTGNEIKSLRNDMGLTQEEFAHEMQVSYSTINRWERDKNAPRRVFANMLTALREKTPHTAR